MKCPINPISLCTSNWHEVVQKSRPMNVLQGIHRQRTGKTKQGRLLNEKWAILSSNVQHQLMRPSSSNIIGVLGPKWLHPQHQLQILEACHYLMILITIIRHSWLQSMLRVGRWNCGVILMICQLMSLQRLMLSNTGTCVTLVPFWI